MKQEIAPHYDPKATEDIIYKLWEESGYFNPDNLPDRQTGLPGERTEPFSIVLPPPNVTGTLHIGHALMLVIEDVLVRFNRMRGKKALWVPGTDHAAIATQAKVESIIYKEEGKTRHDLGREVFLERVEAFARESHDTIVSQIKRMGSSVDWSREAYTLDEARNLAVRTAFKRMYDEGLIYRGKRIVNWDSKLKTTVSDDEVEWIEEKTPLYYLKYGPFTIVTARPETKFGDKYVVMHPDDKRYKKYQHSEKIELEWINGPVTATVIKDEAIDMEFGTGAMTITPWHDMTDFDIAERHKLDFEQIIDYDGKLLPVAGEFAGQHIKKARPLIVGKLESKGLIEKVDDEYSHRIATNSRGGGVIEPQIKEQWFVAVNKEFPMRASNMKGVKTGENVTLKTLMRKAVESQETKIIPDHFEKIYYHWIDNLRDWCISRQIWFGHRIPVWYCLGCGKEYVNLEPKAKWFIVRHGETDWNKEGRLLGQTDIPLNEEGRKQAEKAAEKLKGENIGLIVSSDLSRSRETAEIIGKAIGAEIIFDKKLRERFQGEREGMLREEAREKFKELYPYDNDPAGGETYKELGERAWQALTSHKHKHGGKNVLIVSHSGLIRTLVGKIKNLTPEEMLSRETIKNTEVLSLDIAESCTNCDSEFYEQDPDTLDTWFSSGLWTFSTFGWPNETDDLKTYHPTSVLETGYDILFFWVARMILMSTYLLGEVPFRTVYLHGIVRDKDRQKMSKSKGNVVDPLGVIDLYGTDALRIGLVFNTAPGNDIPLSEDKIRGMKHFANKLWNIARFVLTNTEAAGQGNLEPKTDADKAIFERLDAVTQEITGHLEVFRLHEAAQAAYQFAWHEFADIYIEESKKQLKNESLRASTEAILRHALRRILILLHPFMPFITEEIWHNIQEGKLLMIEPWPASSTTRT